MSMWNTPKASRSTIDEFVQKSVPTRIKRELERERREYQTEEF